MADDLTKALETLTGNIPEPRINLSEDEKDIIVGRVGPLTAANIIKAKKDYSPKRIPFLFSTIDTQDVVDLLANDMRQSIQRAMK